MVTMTIQLDNGRNIQIEIQNKTSTDMREEIAKTLLSSGDWVAFSTDNENMLIDKKHIVCVTFK